LRIALWGRKNHERKGEILDNEKVENEMDFAKGGGGERKDKRGLWDGLISEKGKATRMVT